MRIEELTAQLEAAAVPLSKEQAAGYEARLEAQAQLLANAVEDMHSLMAGAQPCDFCGRSCKMGEGCQFVWKGVKHG